MTEQSVQSWSTVLPLTDTSQNAVQDNDHRTTTGSILNEYDSLEYNSEDVVIHCWKCDTYVKVESLWNHKSYHKALETLQWTKRNPPRDFSCLIEQRNVVLSRLKDELVKKRLKQENTHAHHSSRYECSINNNSTKILSQIEQLNAAFEYMKNEIDPMACSPTPLSSSKAGNINQNRKIDKFFNMSFISKLSCVYGVGICSTQNKTHSKHMEDTAAFEDCLCMGNEENPVDFSYFAVFDGYRGNTAASVASEHLHSFLKDAISSCCPLKTQMAVVSYIKIDSMQIGLQIEDEEKQQKSDGYKQDESKEGQTHISGDWPSAYSIEGILDNCGERIATELIDSKRKQMLNSEMKTPCLTKECLIQKEGFNKEAKIELLHKKEKKLENFKNSSQLKENELHKERYIINKISSHCPNNRIQKKNCQETTEILTKFQNDIDSKDPFILDQTKPKETDQVASMSSAFKMAYQRTDAILSYGVGETSRVRWSGCSAATLLIESIVQHKQANESQDLSYQRTFSKDQLSRDNLVVASSCETSPTTLSAMINPEEVVGKLYIANIGNVQAYLVKGNKAYPVTKRHTPQNKQEKERILQQGGFFTQSSSESLVNGVLKTTRGLGNHGDVKLRRCVPPVPSFYNTDIEQQSQLLIIGSAGVWDVLSGQEAASLLLQLLPMNRLPVPSRVSTSLIQLFNNGLSKGISLSSNDNSKIASSRPSRSSRQDNSQEEKPKGSIISDRNAKSKKDRILSSNSRLPRLIGLCSESEINGKPNFAGGLSGVKDENCRTNTSDQSDITACSQRLVPQSNLRQHFARVLSRYLVQAAKLAGSRQNITAMVVLLPGSGL